MGHPLKGWYNMKKFNKSMEAKDLEHEAKVKAIKNRAKRQEKKGGRK